VRGKTVIAPLYHLLSRFGRGDDALSTPGHGRARGSCGHAPYAHDGGSNWSLSSERAKTIRRALIDAGIAESRFRRIEGVADNDPCNPQNRSDPRNRRIGITVLNAGVPQL